MMRRLFVKWIVGCVIIVCGAAGNPGTAVPEPAVGIKINAIKDLGVIPPPARVMGRDGGYSAWFDHGSIWFFGDTLSEGNRHGAPELQSNSWSWTDDRDASDGIGPFTQAYDSNGLPSALVPFTDAEKTFNLSHREGNCRQVPCGTRYALWPGAIVADSMNRRLLVFYEKLVIEPGDLNYTILGQSIAVWNNLQKPPRRIRFNPGHAEPTLMFNRDEPGFGDAAVIVDGILYVYGCDRQGPQVPCRVARVGLENVFDKRDWVTWAAKDKWSRNLSRGQRIFSGNEILSVAYNRYLGRFLTVYSQPMSLSVMLRTAPRPEGPWSEPVEAFKARTPDSELGWVYDALEHPEYQQEDGKVLYITYSRQISPATFELRLVAVQIEKGGG